MTQVTPQTAQPFFLMDNVIQNYAWGSKTSIQELFSIANPDNQPQAEIWMGAHPNGCSKIEIDNQKTPLAEVISSNKAEFLSAATAQQFGELPYLFKVLAAAKALSIQVHPTKQEAEEGYKKENLAKIPLHAANRNYKDPNHKPEMVYALTSYQAMNGFRAFADIITLFDKVNCQALQPLVTEFSNNQTSDGLAQFFAALLTLDGTQKDKALQELLTYAHAHAGDELFSLIIE